MTTVGADHNTLLRYSFVPFTIVQSVKGCYCKIPAHSYML